MKWISVWIKYCCIKNKFIGIIMHASYLSRSSLALHIFMQRYYMRQKASTNTECNKCTLLEYWDSPSMRRVQEGLLVWAFSAPPDKVRKNLARSRTLVAWFSAFILFFQASNQVLINFPCLLLKILKNMCNKAYQKG